MLQVEQLDKQFGRIKVIDNISFSVPAGRCVAMLGPNGAGKTTTLRIISGLLQATSGQVTLGGIAYSPKNADQYKQRMGYLPQNPQFFSWMSGLEFLVFAGKLHGLSASIAKKKAEQLMEQVGLQLATKKRIGSYSGGMKQRLGIAQAFIHEPDLLIMDEPVSALDPIGRNEIMAMLQQLKRKTTILFSTHVLHDAEQLCDDIIIVKEGKIALQGELASLKEKYDEPLVRMTFSIATDHDKGKVKQLQRKLVTAVQPHSKELMFVDCNLETETLSCKMTDEVIGKQMLWELLASDTYPVTDLQFTSTNLEKLFMKVVTA
ncbi:ABC transporter ATP-binding protein [Paenibacillus yanchengensis]|uniref:ABC transporter ATP-binding protein n=1 Tax=Paenibacillus yanchengensis TaxID=2035833 RepID=A0ABW4YJ00_9BACL